MTQPTKLKQPCSCGSTDNPHTCFGFEPAQPTNIDYKSIEEQVEEAKDQTHDWFYHLELEERGQLLDWLTKTLQERDAIAEERGIAKGRQEEREKAVEAMADITDDLILADIMRKALTPNDKE